MKGNIMNKPQKVAFALTCYALAFAGGSAFATYQAAKIVKNFTDMVVSENENFNRPMSMEDKIQAGLNIRSQF